ncbi:putative R1/2-type MYB transcription factor [Trifolium repens]|nr:putative R1/2-type MYB transcription factor [Trifolium repens]
MATPSATMQWPAQWTREDVKIFERALVMVPEDLPNRWEKIAEQGSGKSAAEVRDHYDNLLHQILEIESGLAEVPNYPDDLVLSGGSGSSDSDSSKKTRHDKEKRKTKKGRPWTEDEHRLFLAGLEKYGKGDWRSISRNFVVTKTPTQVASHAQKYFNHKQQKSEVKNKKRTRTSIHDITLGDSNSSPVPIDQNCVPPLGVGSLQQPQGMHYYPSLPPSDQP